MTKKRYLNLSDIVESNLVSESLLEALSCLEPDHFSYFSSRDRILSSRLGDCGAVSLSEELMGVGLGCRGGGEAGGCGAALGVNMLIVLFMHGGLEIFDKLLALNRELL